MFRNVEVLWIVEIRVEAILNGVDDSRLQVNQEGTRDVVLVIRLVEEHIFAVVSLSRVLFQNTFSANTVLHAQLLPELVTDYATKS